MGEYDFTIWIQERSLWDGTLIPSSSIFFLSKDLLQFKFYRKTVVVIFLLNIIFYHPISRWSLEKFKSATVVKPLDSKQLSRSTAHKISKLCERQSTIYPSLGFMSQCFQVFQKTENTSSRELNETNELMGNESAENQKKKKIAEDKPQRQKMRCPKERCYCLSLWTVKNVVSLSNRQLRFFLEIYVRHEDSSFYRI